MWIFAVAQVADTQRKAEGKPSPTRNGYRLKDLVEQFEAKPAEIKALFGNTLDPTRAVVKI